MGSCGSWDASLSLQKKTNILQKEENSAELIKKFIAKNSSGLYESKNHNKLKKGDILISIDIYDEDEEELGTVTMKELGLENVNAKEFFDKKVYKEHVDEFDFGYVTEPEYWKFNVEIKDLESKLKFLNLKLLQGNLYNWSVKNPNFIFSDEQLASCSDYIYCDNDNSNSDSFTITQKFIDSLNVGDRLVLEGSGDGEHC